MKIRNKLADSRRKICRHPVKNRRDSRKRIKTNGDFIRSMNDRDLAALVIWRATVDCSFRVPDCSELCDDYGCDGCAMMCSLGKRVRVLTAWLRDEYRSER